MTRSATRPAPSGRASGDRANLYDEITGRIIAELEAGRLPWVQPWGTSGVAAPLALPKNATTGRRYSGINVLILWGAVVERGYAAQSWLTFRQALALGGNVRRSVGARPRPDDRHRGRDGRGPIDRQETVMATIGTFTRTGDGFTGTVSTLTLDAKVQVRPAEKSSDKAPDFRIFAGRAEIGAAWKKTSNEGRDYLSVKLDDPSLPAPILANLFEMEGGEFELIWSRPNGNRSRE